MTRVVVTGCAAPGGSVIARLGEDAGWWVKRVDADPWPAGDWTICPEAGPKWVSFMEATEPDVVLPTVDAELFWCDTLPATVGPEPARRRCLDKVAFGEAMNGAGIPHPGYNPSGPGPWVVKPADGRGTRDVIICHTVSEVGAARNIVARNGTVTPVVQDHCSGIEWNAEGYIDREGRRVGLVTYWRWKHSGGFTLRGESFVNPAIDDIIWAATSTVGLTGPFNAQGFAELDGDRTQIVEINPRMSPSAAMATGTGWDIVSCYIDETMGREPEKQEDRAIGVRYTRSFYERWNRPG